MSCGYATHHEEDVWDWRRALWGTAVSHGIAIGLVQRVQSGRQDLSCVDWPSEPHILVTETADPKALELAPFTALGVVTECGGIGSNLAILLRERQIPGVLGVAGACRRLQDGMTVLVDGNKGLILVLTEPLPSLANPDDEAKILAHV